MSSATRETVIQLSREIVDLREEIDNQRAALTDMERALQEREQALEALIAPSSNAGSALEVAEVVKERAFRSPLPRPFALPHEGAGSRPGSLAYRILNIMYGAPEFEYGPQELAGALGAELPHVYAALSRLLEDEKITRKGSGVYIGVPHADATRAT